MSHFHNSANWHLWSIFSNSGHVFCKIKKLHLKIVKNTLRNIRAKFGYNQWICWVVLKKMMIEKVNGWWQRRTKRWTRHIVMAIAHMAFSPSELKKEQILLKSSVELLYFLKYKHTSKIFPIKHNILLLCATSYLYFGVSISVKLHV